MNLQNASVPSSDPVYWDENSGVGCQGQGCPSQASQNSVGSIPSEAFTILGNATTTTTTTSFNDLPCPSPQSGFHDLHDFDPSAGPSGVAIDVAGNVYGALASVGRYGDGLLYKLRHSAAPWFFSSLYDFLGGSSGSSPNSVIVGPGDALYGAAEGGIQGCPNGSYCGLIYEARPGPVACANALCSWDEKTIYQFTGNTDAWGGIVTAFDSAGNLYGIGNGGTNGAGAVFELSPSQGGWTEKILYSFTGGADGGGPNSLLLGYDGNLYGAAGGGNYDPNGCFGWCGVLFRLAPSGGGWTETVIYAFPGGGGGFGPRGLIQSGPNTLYGIGTCSNIGDGYCQEYGNLNDSMIFGAGYDGGVSVLHAYSNGECVWSNIGTYDAVAVGPEGHLYVTENAGIEYFCSAVVDLYWGSVIVSGPVGMFGNMTSDANGNLYGTTSACGFESLQRNTGMIWQYSP